MVPEFIARIRGSKCVGNAHQTNFGGGLGEREAKRSLPQRETLQRGTTQTLAASIYGGQWSSPEPAAASACRLSLPTVTLAKHYPRTFRPGRILRL